MRHIQVPLPANGNKKISGHRMKERERKRHLDLTSSINGPFSCSSRISDTILIKLHCDFQGSILQKNVAKWLISSLVLGKAEDLWTITRDQETLMNIFAEMTSLSEEKNGSHSLSCRMIMREFKVM